MQRHRPETARSTSFALNEPKLTVAFAKCQPKQTREKKITVAHVCMAPYSCINKTFELMKMKML